MPAAAPRGALIALAMLVAAACSSPPPDAPPPPPAEAACAAGTARVGEACEPIVSSAPCAAGTRPVVGSETCAPVGVTTCASGFEKDASGWGCAPVLPDAACAGATRDALGSKSCLPVGDCALPFPPAGAVIVDPGLADAALDATHVRLLADAAVPANDGKTLALVDGPHVVDDVLLGQKLTIVGRCAERTRLVPATAAPASRGVRVSGAVRVRGVTFSGFGGAVTVGAPGDLVLEDAVVEGAKWRGVVVDRAGRARLTRVVVRGTNERTPREQTVALIAGAGGVVTVEDSAFVDNVDAAVVATDGPGTRIDVTRSVIRGMLPRSDGVGGSAVRAFEDARVALTESAILGARGIAILTLRRNKPPPEVTLLRSVVSETLATVEGGREIATALNAGPGASIRVLDSTVRDTSGVGAYAADGGNLLLTTSVVVRSKRNKDQLGFALAARGASLVVEESAVVDSSSAAVTASADGKITFTRSAVFGVGGDERDGLPMGFGLSASERSVITATDSAIVGASEIGASATGPGSALRLERVYMGPRGAAQGKFAHAVLAVDKAAASVSGSIIEGHAGAALFFAGAGGFATTSLIRDNAVAVQAQEGSSVDEADAVPSAITETTLTVVRDTIFSRNATRLGSGSLPLPAPLGAPQN